MHRCETSTTYESVLPATVTDCFISLTVDNVQVRLRIGMYYPFIADWLRVFPVEQVMFIRYEDYITSPSEIINNVCKFLGIRKFVFSSLLFAYKCCCKWQMCLVYCHLKNGIMSMSLNRVRPTVTCL